MTKIKIFRNPQAIVVVTLLALVILSGELIFSNVEGLSSNLMRTFNVLIAVCTTAIGIVCIKEIKILRAKNTAYYWLAMWIPVILCTAIYFALEVLKDPVIAFTDDQGGFYIGNGPSDSTINFCTVLVVVMFSFSFLFGLLHPSFSIAANLTIVNMLMLFFPEFDTRIYFGGLCALLLIGTVLSFVGKIIVGGGWRKFIEEQCIQ
jgi:hypothetical protein